MANNDVNEMTIDELRDYSKSEGLIDNTEHYDYLTALHLVQLLQKDIEAFKKLSPQERKVIYWEYKKEAELLSDDEIIDRHEKYLTAEICEKLDKIATEG